MSFADEVAAGERYEFGRNWRRFLDLLDDERIRTAEQSLQNMLGDSDLSGKSFLDIGSGSGLSSLAARRLGARVVSFDFDPESVACTETVKARFFPEDPAWKVQRGSVLDEDYLASLGSFDIVYSWGVLHHTGDMWKAVDLAASHVNPGGRFFIALYNDQGLQRRIWLKAKRLYCSGTGGRFMTSATFGSYLYLKTAFRCLVLRRNVFRDARRKRGMSYARDVADWLGGYPYQVAEPGVVVDRVLERDFSLIRLKTTNSIGCNEFVFKRHH